MAIQIELVQNDITELDLHAIVNAANNSLRGGGGVDGAIHRKAGPKLLEECITLNGCEAGDAKITHAYELRSRYVIHTVGPIWQGGNKNEEELLKSCYIRSLEVADDNNCCGVAFPNISTGIYGFPKDLAADIAIAAVREYSKKSKSVELVVFCCFDDDNFEIYHRKLHIK